MSELGSEVILGLATAEGISRRGWGWSQMEMAPSGRVSERCKGSRWVCCPQPVTPSTAQAPLRASVAWMQTSETTCVLAPSQSQVASTSELQAQRFQRPPLSLGLTKPSLFGGRGSPLQALVSSVWKRLALTETSPARSFIFSCGIR